MFERFAVPPNLSGSVEAFWHLQTDGNRTFSGLPKPWVEMIFSLRGRHIWWAGLGMPSYPYDHSWITPLQSGVRYAHTFGDLDLFGVRLDIFAAYCLFGDPIIAEGYRPIPIASVLGGEADTLRQSIIEATNAERIVLLSEWLSSKIGSDVLQAPPIEILELGEWRVSALADAMMVGPRTLHKLFTNATGRPPKFWLRLARFDRAVQIAGLQPEGISLSDLAAKTGYADQAHMNREFSEFGDLSPGTYVLSRERPVIAPPHLVIVPNTQ